MKVLHILKTSTGASWAYNQIKELAKQNIDIIVMLPNSKIGFAKKYRELNIQVIEYDASLPIKKPWKLINKCKEFRKIVNDIKPDIIQCHFVINIMFVRIALRNMNIPRIFQVPGPLHLENIFFKYAEILTSNKQDYWVGSCTKTCDIYKKSNIPKERIFFGIYTNSDLDKCVELSKRTGKIRKELDIDEETFVIGMVSYFYKPKYHLLQFTGIKGHEDFIKAFKMLKNIVDKKIVAIICGGPALNAEKYMKKVERMANRYCGNDIYFTGFRQDIKEIYPDFDLVVHPSRSENHGGAGESIALGVPTLTSDTGGFPDIIKEGQTGYMFKTGNYKDMAYKMKYIIENYDEAKKVTRQGQKYVSSINSKLSATQIKDIYNKIIESRKNQ